MVGEGPENPSPDDGRAARSPLARGERGVEHNEVVERLTHAIDPTSARMRLAFVLEAKNVNRCRS
jgi:hypothetical protein